MPEYFYLTQKDRELLDRLAIIFKGHVTPNRPYDLEDALPHSPDVYIAKVPEDGIPAATNAEEDGDPDLVDGDIAGSAECDIYRIINDEILATGAKQTVKNISSSDVNQSWITIVREKFGNWIAQAGGGESWEVLFEICETCCPECWAVATILYKNKGGVPPLSGEIITVCTGTGPYFPYDYDYYYPGIQRKLKPWQIRIWDKMDCFLNSSKNLVGRRGFAKLMIPDLNTCALGPDGDVEESCRGVALPAAGGTQPLWIINSMAGPVLCEDGV